MKPILIGLTGGVGVGKSSVAAILRELGAEIIVGDELGRIALEESPELLAAVRDRFGDSVFAEGKLLRRELGRRVFTAPDETRWLTELTFPRIHELWRDAVRHSQREVIVFDAALIPEWGIENEFDFLIVVTASPESVSQRLVSSGRLTSDEINARQAIQALSAKTGTLQATRIVNDGSQDDLRRQIEEFWKSKIEPELKRRRYP